MRKPSPKEIEEYAHNMEIEVTKKMWDTNPDVMSSCHIGERVGYKLDAQLFWDYYEQRKWKVPFGGRAIKMHNWQLEVNNWARRSIRNGRFEPYKKSSTFAEEIITEFERQRAEMERQNEA